MSATKISGVFILIFFGMECSICQVNPGNSNTPNTYTPAAIQNQAQSGQSVMNPDNLQDGVYKPDMNPYRRVVPPAFIREADVIWSTRVWRIIDIREKINLPLYYPLEANGSRVSLFDLLREQVMSGEIHAYVFNPSDLDDTYRVRMTKTEILGALSRTDTVTDENGNSKVITINVDAGAIKGYMIKEDWIFEKQRSIMLPTILFLCPRVENVNSNTGKEDENQPPISLFWLYFPDIRPLLAKTPVFNIKNDAEWRTFDDIFCKRQFSSYIIQQSNVFNRSIAAYMKGLDVLLEGEKINEKIRNIEIDMWQY